MEQGFDIPRRTFEIIPAFISWSIIIIFISFAFLRPTVYAAFIIAFDIYWAMRAVYFTSLLVIAHRRLNLEKNRDWLSQCKKLFPGQWQGMYQAVIFPVYKEGSNLLISSLDALKDANYPKDRMIVVMAFEERVVDAREKAAALEARYKDSFPAYLSTFHPDGIAHEARTKGANATWAARKLKEFIDKKSITYENVIVSCFDADTCVEKGYFGCLLYHYLSSDEPLRSSYQPIPVYNNNIWHAPSFARIIEITSSYCQLIDSMRLEKFVTFSSHSMSFKTLVDVGYWPVDKVSDDSLIYWKAFVHYHGNYRVVPMYITVSMDVAYGKGLWETLLMQYKQKRRWAWGIEVFPYLMLEFKANDLIPLRKKIRKSLQILDSHVVWAVWAILLTIISPIPIILGAVLFKKTVIGVNLPRITGVLFNLTNLTLLLWMGLSLSLLPSRPLDLKLSARIKIITQWLLVPFAVMLVGSLPALDAQTRLALGKYMEFTYTEKQRRP